MMKNNLVYYIMTYIMYLYPPFILFMLLINFESMQDTWIWIIGLMVNVVFILVTTLVLYLLAIKQKIPMIDADEKNHVIFGYIGNIIVFLYVYQNWMHIAQFYSIFSLVLILVLTYKYLISKKITFKEILVFSILFGVIDYIIIIISGNTLLGDQNTSFTDAQSLVFQLLFTLSLLFTIGWYGYKLYRNHTWQLLRFVLIGFIVLSLVLFYMDIQMEVVGTIAILAVFAWLIDIILRLIHKSFKTIDLAFYARLIMVTVVLLMIKDWELYRLPSFDIEQMSLLIGIFYVTAFSDIIMNVTPKKDIDIALSLSVESYIKTLFKPIISRYKDVIVYAHEETLRHDLSSLGRQVIIRSDFDDFKQFDDHAISFVVVYVRDIEDMKRIVERIPKKNICVISDQMITDPLLKTSFTDFKDYVYTI